MFCLKLTEEPNEAKPSIDTSDDNLAAHLMDNVDPKEAWASTEICIPILAFWRTLREEPTDTKLNIDTYEPQATLDLIDRVLPSVTSAKTESESPPNTRDTTDIDDPKRATLRSDIVLPHWNVSRTDI
jgi:hypothetical protein